MRYANSQRGDEFLFGSDFPLIAPERWIVAYGEAGFKPELRDKILNGDAEKILGL